MIHDSVASLFGVRPKGQVYVSNDYPRPVHRPRRPSDIESAVLSVRKLASAVIPAPDFGAPFSPQPATSIRSQPRQRDSRWMNLFDEGADAESYYQHDESQRQAIQEFETSNYSLRLSSPLSATKVLDFRHLDRAAPPSETVVQDFGTYCESPRPFTERGDTYRSDAGDSRHQSTLAAILNEMEQPNQGHIQTGMPATWASSSGTTPTDDQSFYDQQVHMPGAQDGYPYSH